MPAIRIDFPKTSHAVSTWVADEDWYPLTVRERNALVYRYIKNHHPLLLLAARQTRSHRRPETEDYLWSEF